MAKNDNAHAVRLVSSLAQTVGPEKAREFEESYPLSKSASSEKKFKWAQNACAYLEQNFDPETIAVIRKACRCSDGKSNAAKLRKYLEQTDTIEDFVKAFNQNETFASLEYISDHKILFCYPECYCSCVKRVPQTLSETWCACTVGNAEETFRAVFHDGVRVTLRESIKTGADRCALEVEW